MITIHNISAGQASGYYTRDNYYMRSGEGSWLGKLKGTHNLQDRMTTEDFDRMLRLHEKFRTYEIVGHTSLEVCKQVEDSSNMERIQLKVFNHVLKVIQDDLETKYGKTIRFRCDIEREPYKGGGVDYRVKTHNVAPRYWGVFFETLKDSKYQSIYRLEMKRALEELGVVATVKDFNLKTFEKSGRVGFDLTFSAPKSLSIAMTINDEFKDALQRAHDRAVEDTLQFIQNNFIEYRTTREVVRKQSDQVLIAKVDHFLSRRLDPQLHSHCILFNSCRGDDGKLRSIENDLIYSKRKLLDTHYYKVQLAHYVRSAGFEIDISGIGKWELKGISREQIEAFSKGREQILTHIEENGLDLNNPRERELANLLTRQASKKVDFEALQEAWRITREECGIDRETLKISSPPIENQYLDGGIEKFQDLFLKQIDYFNRDDFVFSLAPEALRQNLSVRDIEALFTKNLETTRFVEVNFGDKTYITSKENLDLEKRIFDRVLEGIGVSKLWTDPGSLGDLPTEPQPTREQVAAIEHIVASRDTFSAINGVAGSGKTSSVLKHANRILEEAGFEVRGLSFTGKAALGIQEEAGISSSTIHSFLNRLEREAGNKTNVSPGEIQNEWNFNGLSSSSKREIWLIDEANMINNKLMDYLQEASLKRGARVVFTGDYRQLQPIGPGNIYSRMIVENKINAVDIKEGLRFRNAPQNIRSSVDFAAAGDVKRSLASLDEYILEIPTQNERLEYLAQRFTALSPEQRELAVIVTGLNRDRIAINLMVRNIMKANGEISPGITLSMQTQNLKKFEREFSVNDAVIFLKNDKNLGVFNGQKGRIADISPDSLSVLSGGKVIDLNLKEYNYLDHYYASTTWKAEGSTFQYVFVNIDTNQSLINSREDYYVKVSRTRQQLEIVTDNRNRLFYAVETSSFVSDCTPSARRKNAYNILPPNIRNDLDQAYQHYSNFIDQKKQASFFYEKMNASKNPEDLHHALYYFHKHDSFSHQNLSQASQLFDHALGSYDSHLQQIFSDPETRSSYLKTFRSSFIPEYSQSHSKRHNMDFDISHKGFSHIPIPQERIVDFPLFDKNEFGKSIDHGGITF